MPGRRGEREQSIGVLKIALTLHLNGLALRVHAQQRLSCPGMH